MKQDIILAGVGGQGILSIATVIGSAALEQGLYLKQAEVHGMSQRDKIGKYYTTKIIKNTVLFFSSKVQQSMR